MHKLLTLSICTISLFALGLAQAKPTEQAKKPTTAIPQQANQILLYNKPNGQVIAKLPPLTRLVPIYRERDWVKVGNRDNGQVGWVNRKQLRHVREAAFKPQMQSIYIDVQRNDNKQGDHVDIIAYRNGKKLSPEESKALYKQLREQQKQQARAMRHYFHDMNRIFIDDMRQMQQLQNSVDQPIILMPGPVIQPKTKQAPSESAAPEKKKVSV